MVYSTMVCDTADRTVWRNWNFDDTTVNVSSGTSVTFTDCTWSNWNTTTAITIDFLDETVWHDWQRNSIDHVTRADSAINPKRLKAERRKEKRLKLELRKKLEAIEKKKLAAERKAKELLLDLIGPKELKVYEETGRLFVKGKKHDYIIRKQGFVQQIEKDKITDLCISFVVPDLPVDDKVVGLKLLFERDENRALKVANRHGIHPIPDVIPLAACM